VGRILSSRKDARHFPQRNTEVLQAYAVAYGAKSNRTGEKESAVTNQTYRVFTIENGTVSEGAKIENLHLKGAGMSIPAVLVGEEGRGRHQEAMPIDGPPMVACPDRGKDFYESADKCKKCGVQLGTPTPTKGGWSGETRNHPDQGLVLGTLKFAEIGATKAGKPKFFAKNAPTTDEKVIVVFRTQIGFRGGNSHTGDKFYVPCPKRGQHVTAQYICDDCSERIIPKPEDGGTVEENNAHNERFYAGAIHPDAGDVAKFKEFPGEKIVAGRIAQGDAGSMGSGDQIIALIPAGMVFRTGYSGRMYGKPAAHFYLWNGEKLIAATWDERAAADLF
jgi:hypothetical protein